MEPVSIVGQPHDACARRREHAKPRGASDETGDQDWYFTASCGSTPARIWPVIMPAKEQLGFDRKPLALQGRVQCIEAETDTRHVRPVASCSTFSPGTSSSGLDPIPKSITASTHGSRS